jgi:hypothetical protein
MVIMERKKSIIKILFIIGIVLIAIGLAVFIIKIPLTTEESNALLKGCADCKSAPTYRNIDPNIAYTMIFVGIPMICVGAVIRFVL